MATSYIQSDMSCKNEGAGWRKRPQTKTAEEWIVPYKASNCPENDLLIQKKNRTKK